MDRLYPEEVKMEGIKAGLRRSKLPQVGPKVTIELMHWIHGEPREFPCFMCGKGKGEWRVRIEEGPVVVNVVVCGGCLDKGEREIVGHFLGPGGGEGERPRGPEGKGGRGL